MLFSGAFFLIIRLLKSHERQQKHLSLALINRNQMSARLKKTKAGSPMSNRGDAL